MPTRSFLASLNEWAKCQPDAPALSCGDRLVSYAELVQMADSACSGIARLDPAPVCVPARKSPEIIARIVGCLMADRRVLLPSADLGPDALELLCSQVGCRQPEPAEPGFLLTTSGSTGVPKTVVLSTPGVDRFLAWGAQRFEIGPGRVVLSYAPLNFDLALLDVWATLAAGACVELVDPAQAVRGGYLLDLCRRRAPSLIQAVPMLYRLLADAMRDGPGLGSVEHAVFTGDAMPTRLLRQFPDLFPRAVLWNIYGCTETNDSFIYRVVNVAEAGAQGAVPIGRPIDGVDAIIVDESGSPVAGPGVGELLVATPFQAVGYLDHRLSEQKWRDGYFHTGDLVRRDDNGLFHLIGRTDHQVKVRGVRTNLQAIEQVLLDHPNVLEVGVIAVPDELAGSRLSAIVRPRPRTSLNGLDLRTHCAGRLPRTAIPSVIEIVDHPLPRTSTGKVDRGSLAVSRRG